MIVTKKQKQKINNKKTCIHVYSVQSGSTDTVPIV